LNLLNQATIIYSLFLVQNDPLAPVSVIFNNEVCVTLKTIILYNTCLKKYKQVTPAACQPINEQAQQTRYWRPTN
jgi:hypothetical protein